MAEQHGCGGWCYYRQCECPCHDPASGEVCPDCGRREDECTCPMLYDGWMPGD